MFLLAVTQASNNDKLVTDMQNKLTEIQQHELEFLNNFITHLGWIFGGVVSVIGIIAIYIGYANRQAEKKMKDAEKVLGEAEAVRLALIQDQADLTAYREETRKEFSELISLVNSEEIANLKKDIAILSITSQIRGNLEEGERMIDNSWEDYRYIKRNGEDIITSITSEYRNCKASMINMRNKIKEPLANLTEANELLGESIKLKERVAKLFAELRFDAETLLLQNAMKHSREKADSPDK
jgi:uncharacterized membrane protein YciS (DUF1049 family)